MTDPLFRSDAYQRDAEAEVVAHTPEGGIILNKSIFYPTSGGQPGDSGTLRWDGETMPIATAVKGEGTTIVLVPAEPTRMPKVGQMVGQTLDWDRRYRHMRMHTALHLLSVVLPLPVTGGAIGADRGRLDFLMPEPPSNRDEIEQRLNELVDLDLPVSEHWITEDELDENPGLVKTMSVQPPRGQGHIRLVRIGEGDAQVDLQPCGGTHVARTAEIGMLKLGKIENKGKQNRRVSITFDD